MRAGNYILSHTFCHFCQISGHFLHICRSLWWQYIPAGTVHMLNQSWTKVIRLGLNKSWTNLIRRFDQTSFILPIIPLLIVYTSDWFRIGSAIIHICTYPFVQISVHLSLSWINNPCRDAIGGVNSTISLYNVTLMLDLDLWL